MDGLTHEQCQNYIPQILSGDTLNSKLLCLGNMNWINNNCGSESPYSLRRNNLPFSSGISSVNSSTKLDGNIPSLPLFVPSHQPSSSCKGRTVIFQVIESLNYSHLKI